MPDNASFMVAAYAAAAIIYGAYAISLVARRRRVRDHLTTQRGSTRT
jgi:hypothetical protein